MTSQLTGVRQRADELVGESGVVTGPLKGYHHETYVLTMPGETRIVKLREPRERILWFDRRCFRSEEALLRALNGRITHIPVIHDVEGMALQVFIEGRTLKSRPWGDRRIPERVRGQIVDLFGELAHVTPDTLEVDRSCKAKDRAEDGDCDDFLERLIVFVEKKVYEENSERFGRLFTELGLHPDAFVQLRKNVSGLTRRDFCLLHADLHRENFVLDPSNQLWSIDWELAMLGDPLYDLATHLYLMSYPEDQERRMAEDWAGAVRGVRPSSARGWADDLDRILAFKRAQSVFTDVIRLSLSLRDGSGVNWVRLPSAVRKLQAIMTAAAGPLGLVEIPSRPRIAAALARWANTPAPPAVEGAVASGA
ncbi:aminoglycoside phosphotransferase family protein [Streptomyces sp. MBT62]|uniref:aminoglycoside phosphotransferase family protein n=1 Tax=Streptomyces sp. MBT62 TaxID=2800410 RepID=UPI00190A53BF|nr:aminoglycoside phosphotransferase family protein [Streptomyces sp. MBT62]MBK3569509.1 aminoglycoside phosphotransferase family protein [Streptomyces sp. MBT62]